MILESYIRGKLNVIRSAHFYNDSNKNIDFRVLSPCCLITYCDITDPAFIKFKEENMIKGSCDNCKYLEKKMNSNMLSCGMAELSPRSFLIRNDFNKII